MHISGFHYITIVELSGYKVQIVCWVSLLTLALPRWRKYATPINVIMNITTFGLFVHSAADPSPIWQHSLQHCIVLQHCSVSNSGTGWQWWCDHPYNLCSRSLNLFTQGAISDLKDRRLFCLRELCARKQVLILQVPTVPGCSACCWVGGNPPHQTHVNCQKQALTPLLQTFSRINVDMTPLMYMLQLQFLQAHCEAHCHTYVHLLTVLHTQHHQHTTAKSLRLYTSVLHPCSPAPQA